ncbi:MAG: hypothetical protein K9J13_09700 [Saprospiraceae bacterium]|nr:hypothetical protein [Saprospiraceae bacterium]
MKKIIVLGLVVIFITALSSCGKYDEGPSFSLRSKKARLCQTWKFTKVVENDVDDVTPLYYGQQITFEKGGTWNSVNDSTSTTSSGKWEFITDKEELSLSFDDSPVPEIYRILKLKKDEFWYTQTVFKEEIEYHMIPK